MKVRLHEGEAGGAPTRPLLEALGLEICEILPALPGGDAECPDHGNVPDLVVWDLSTDPEVTAREVRFLLSDPGLSRVPFIVFLPREQIGLEMAVLGAGCAGVVTHPISVAKISRVLTDFVGGRSPPRRDVERGPEPTTALVAAGDPELNVAVAEILRHDSHVVFTADDDVAARALARRVGFDFCIVSSGTEPSLRELRRQLEEDGAGTAVIVAGGRDAGWSADVAAGPGIVVFTQDPRDEHELRRAVAGALHERTEQLRSRKLGAEIAAKQRELQRVNETLRTINKAIRDTNVRLEQQGHLKDEVIGIAAHELKSPLAAVGGALQILTNGIDRFEDGDAELIRLIGRNVSRMIKLVNDILDLARLESGRVKVKQEPTNPSVLIEQAVTTVGVAAKAKGIRFDVKEDRTDRLVPLDPDRVAQMLINLLDNAVKFSPKDSVVRVHVKYRRRRMHVVVSDTGPGIPEAERERVFESFHHEARGDDPHAAGSGLGLTITRVLADLHGGGITVGESPEGGAQFTLTFPLTP